MSTYVALVILFIGREGVHSSHRKSSILKTSIEKDFELLRSQTEPRPHYVQMEHIY